MVQIHHNINPSPHALWGAILPIGVILHRDIQDANNGSEITFHDGVGVLMQKVEMKVKSEFADTVSKLIYSLPIQTVFDRMKANWRDRMDDERVLLIVYKVKKVG